MQEIIQNILGQKGPEWTEALTSMAGFSSDQAKTFLPSVLQGVTNAAADGKLDASEITSKLDVAELASKCGVDEAKAQAGLSTLLPGILSALQGEGGLGGLLGKAGGMASKLFGN